MKHTVLEEQQWREATRTSSLAAAYQTPFWASLLNQSGLACRPRCYRLDFESGRSATVPGMNVPKFGGLLAGWYSMPMGRYGGPLFEQPLSREEWVEMCEFLSSGLTRIAAVLELPPGVVPPEDLPDWIQVEETSHQVVPLEEDFEAVFQRFTRNKRTFVRKARREGMVVVDGEGEQDVRTLVKVYEQASRDWPDTMSVPLVENLARQCLAEGSPARLRLVKQDDKVLAAGIFLYHNDKADPIVACVEPDSRDIEGTTLLYADEMEYACRRGCRTFDFGASLNIESLERYKTYLGAEKRPRYRVICRNRLWRTMDKMRKGQMERK